MSKPFVINVDWRMVAIIVLLIISFRVYEKIVVPDFQKVDVTYSKMCDYEKEVNFEEECRTDNNKVACRRYMDCNISESAKLFSHLKIIIIFSVVFVFLFLLAYYKIWEVDRS